MKFKLNAGWTKESMIQRIKERNDGVMCIDPEAGSCVYENEVGNHCAVGCFIPKDHDALTFICDAWELTGHFPEFVKDWPLTPEGMYGLQEAHDSALERYSMHEVLTDWVNENVA